MVKSVGLDEVGVVYSRAVGENKDKSSVVKKWSHKVKRIKRV